MVKLKGFFATDKRIQTGQKLDAPNSIPEKGGGGIENLDLKKLIYLGHKIAGSAHKVIQVHCEGVLFYKGWQISAKVSKVRQNAYVWGVKTK